MEIVNKTFAKDALIMSATKKIVLRVIESLGGFDFLQWKNRHQPLILMYHRILDDAAIAGLSPSVFEKQIIYIKKHFRVVSIETLIHEIDTHTLKPSTIAITFDDGHYDFYENAWPILKKHDIPVSLYITTGFVDGHLWLWPDLLKYILDNNKHESLSIPEFNTLSTLNHHVQRTWHTLGDYCLTLNVNQRTDFLQRLSIATSVSIPTSPIKSFAAVTWSQLQEMQSGGLIIGSHTVSHPILSTLNETDLHHELQNSADAIEQHLGNRPKGICYPNGRPEDINALVIKTAKNLGYSYGLMGRKMSVSKDRQYMIGRLAANKNFDYFKWTLSRRQNDTSDTYLQ